MLVVYVYRLQRVTTYSVLPTNVLSWSLYAMTFHLYHSIHMLYMYIRIYIVISMPIFCIRYMTCLWSSKWKLCTVCIVMANALSYKFNVPILPSFQGWLCTLHVAFLDLYVHLQDTQTTLVTYLTQWTTVIFRYVNW